MQNDQNVHMMARVSTNNTPLKEIGQWVPPQMASHQVKPDSPSNLGRPWVWTSRPGGFRSGPVSWPAFGIGQFIFGFAGHSLLLLCSCEVLTQLGISLTGAAERMGRMRIEDLDHLFQTRAVQHVTLTDSMAIWVPYGWVPMAMACPAEAGEPATLHAFLPFYNDDLCHCSKATMYKVLASLESFEFDPTVIPLTDTGRRMKDLTQVMEWLRAVLEGSSDASNDAGASSQANVGAGPGERIPGAEGHFFRPRKRARTTTSSVADILSSAEVGQPASEAVAGHGQGDSEPKSVS